MPRQLYVDGVRASRTSGNASQMLGAMAKVQNQTPAGVAPAHYVVAKGTMAGWRNAGDIEMV